MFQLIWYTQYCSSIC